ncbi:hypothetical protein C8Q74DRAFT_1313836 [Fomes fomentarius]|nr:hypothetical protein C8Q74DRAFT_1313836 [Fomes fomentarius]
MLIELALALSSGRQHGPYHGARIINPDSMQVYAGMDVITNKVPKPGEQLTGAEWIRDAIEVVRVSADAVQHLLFRDRMASLDKSGDGASQATPCSPLSASEAFLKALASLPLDLLAFADTNPQPCLGLHRLLELFDLLVAQRWHWRDSKKVLTNWRVIREQSRTPDVLKPRLDARVDWMIAAGTIATAGSNLAEKHTDDGSSAEGSPRMDYTLGIYQLIGYKEFHDYLNSPEPSETAYAKRQVAWIRNKFLPVVNAANASNMGRLHLPDPATLSQTAAKMLTVPEQLTDPLAVLSANQRVKCEIRLLNPGEHVMMDKAKWNAYARSRGHRRTPAMYAYKRARGPLRGKYGQ